jgi:hypothetical protein
MKLGSWKCHKKYSPCLRWRWRKSSLSSWKECWAVSLCLDSASWSCSQKQLWPSTGKMYGQRTPCAFCHLHELEQHRMPLKFNAYLSLHRWIRGALLHYRCLWARHLSSRWNFILLHCCFTLSWGLGDTAPNVSYFMLLFVSCFLFFFNIPSLCASQIMGQWCRRWKECYCYVPGNKERNTGLAECIHRIMFLHCLQTTTTVKTVDWSGPLV